MAILLVSTGSLERRQHLPESNDNGSARFDHHPLRPGRSSVTPFDILSTLSKHPPIRVPLNVSFWQHVSHIYIYIYIYRVAARAAAMYVYIYIYVNNVYI